MENFKSNIIALRGVAESHIGGRPENQDDMDFLDTPLGFLCIVCDGMGGGPAGKSASYIVKYEIGKALNECSPQMPRENAIKMAVAKAQEALENKMAEVPEFIGMGSTFVAVLINEDSAVVAHAGDSRCYQIRGGKVLFRTRDHSLVEELVKRKTLTEEEARLSPQSNVIIRGLGHVKNNAAEFTELPYRKGDRFILCTDGVWGAMHHKELDKRLTAKIDEKLLLDNISNEIDQIGKAQGGHHDNHTISIVCMECNSKLKDKWMKLHSFIIAGLVALFIVMAITIIMQFFKVFDALEKWFSHPQESIVQNDGNFPLQVTPEQPNSISDLDTINRQKLDTILAFIPDSLKAKELNDSTFTDTTSVMAIIQELNRTLKKLRDSKDKQLKNAKAKKENIHKSSLSLVEELKNNSCWSNGSLHKVEKLEKIVKEKSGNTYAIALVDKKMDNGYYTSTGAAKLKIKEALDIIDELMNEINQNENGNNDTSR